MRGGELPPDVWGGYPYKIWLREAEHRGQPVVLSEVGGLLSQPETPREQWDELYGAYASCGSPEELFEAYADLMRGLSELPFLAGWCYTQLTDIELEINGLLTYDRTPKIAPERIEALHRELFPNMQNRCAGREYSQTRYAACKFLDASRSYEHSTHNRQTGRT